MALFVPRYCQAVFHGNSLTVGSGATTPATQNFVVQTRALLDASQATRPHSFWGMANRGTGSITTTALIAEFATVVHPFHNPNRKRNVVGILEVINDIRHLNVTDAQALANLLLYIEQARDLGWTPLLFTVPPTGPADTLDDGLPGVTTGPALVNAYLRAHPELSPLPLVDIAATGVLDDPTDLAKWNADQVHPNETGYAQVAGLLHTALAPF